MADALTDITHGNAKLFGGVAYARIVARHSACKSEALEAGGGGRPAGGARAGKNLLPGCDLERLRARDEGGSVRRAARATITEALAGQRQARRPTARSTRCAPWAHAYGSYYQMLLRWTLLHWTRTLEP